MGCRSPLSSAHVLPEGCATSNLGFHATDNVGRGYHAHSTRAGRARGDGGRCAHGVRETCAALPMAGHAPCARLVSVRAQFMCATCSDVIGGGCEVTFTRLACENWPGKRHQEIYAALIAVDSTLSVTPLSRGRGKSELVVPLSGSLRAGRATGDSGFGGGVIRLPDAMTETRCQLGTSRNRGGTT